MYGVTAEASGEGEGGASWYESGAQPDSLRSYPGGGNSDEVEALLHVAYSIPCMRERVLVRALA